MASKKRKYFSVTRKTILVTSVLFCFIFSFLTSSGNSFSRTEKETTISSFSGAASGESLVTNGPGVPAIACVTKSNSHGGSMSKDSAFQNLKLNSAFIQKKFYNNFSKQTFYHRQFALRLHLAFCVLLI